MARFSQLRHFSVSASRAQIARRLPVSTAICPPNLPATARDCFPGPIDHSARILRHGAILAEVAHLPSNCPQCSREIRHLRLFQFSTVSLIFARKIPTEFSSVFSEFLGLLFFSSLKIFFFYQMVKNGALTK